MLGSKNSGNYEQGEGQSSSNSDNDSSTGPQSNNQVNGMESNNDSTQDNINDGSVWLGGGIRVQRGCRYSLGMGSARDHDGCSYQEIRIELQLLTS